MALFTTFRMQKDDNIILLCQCFKKKVIYKQVVSKGLCMESRSLLQAAADNLIVAIIRTD